MRSEVTYYKILNFVIVFSLYYIHLVDELLLARQTLLRPDGFSD